MSNDLHLVLAPDRWPTGRPSAARPLRVAVIGPSRNPVVEPFAGGLEAFVDGLVRGLRVRGHQVTLFAACGSPDADPRYRLTSGNWAPSTAAERDRSMPAAEFLQDHHQHLRLMLALAGELGDEFDVVHNHSLHHLPIALASSLRVPVVTTLHTPPTPWLESAIELGRHGVARWTAVSSATARQWTCLAGDVEVVRNGVDLVRWPLGPGGDRLVWSGRLTPEKAPHLAVQAARRAGRPIDLAGPVGDPRYVREVLLPELGPHDRHLGHLSQRDLAQVVGRAAVALVTPDWEEPFGLVAAEAMACGTPVVGFHRGGLPEVVRPGGGLLVPAGDVGALAAAVGRAATLDRAGVRATVAGAASVDVMLRRYEQVYADVVRTSRRVHGAHAVAAEA